MKEQRTKNQTFLKKKHKMQELTSFNTSRSIIIKTIYLLSKIDKSILKQIAQKRPEIGRAHV